MSCNHDQYLKGYNTAKSKYLKEITKIKKEYESKHVDYTQVFPYNLIESMDDEWHEIDMPYCAMFLKKTIAKNLTDREQRILSLRYEHGFNLEETGKEFGVTRERIRQIEARAIRKLRRPSLTIKKPKNWKAEKRINGKVEFNCPVCNRLYTDRINYCPSCGQRIDWSEEWKI